MPRKRHAAVPDVYIKLPFPIFAFPHYHVFALIPYGLALFRLDRERILANLIC